MLVNVQPTLTHRRTSNAQLFAIAHYYSKPKRELRLMTNVQWARQQPVKNYTKSGTFVNNSNVHQRPLSEVGPDHRQVEKEGL
jgi:hypothetical protein